MELNLPYSWLIYGATAGEGMGGGEGGLGGQEQCGGLSLAKGKMAAPTGTSRSCSSHWSEVKHSLVLRF